MTFVFTLLACYFLAVPGMYVILRLRLASSITEVIATGFFLGFGLIVLVYLGLAWYLPIGAIDILVCAGATVTLGLLVRELRRQRLPLWIVPTDHIQTLLVGLTLLFMLLTAFGDLTAFIDDDVWIHLPIIKRIAIGDIPPHVPFFPDSYLRGHVGRNLFTGTIARLINLRPELAIIYVTVAVCPAYILVFHAFARRLAGGRSIPTCFCFFGLLFLVSVQIGDIFQIRAGSITYVWNNNAFAYSYAVFFGWLIERAVSTLSRDENLGAVSIVRAHFPVVLVLTAAYAALYFVYISNFLMFSLFLAFLPLLLTASDGQYRLRRFIEAGVIVAAIVLGAIGLMVLVSPFFVERVLISLNVIGTDEPLSFMQQAHFAFPKAQPFSISDPLWHEIPFLTWASLSAQGLSFYLGLSGLLIGLMVRNISIAATSLFGWLTMLWLLLVDMGEFGNETPRLALLAHMGFGASTGLIVGFGVERAMAWFERVKQFGAVGSWIERLNLSTRLLVVRLGSWIERLNLSTRLLVVGLGSWIERLNLAIRLLLNRPVGVVGLGSWIERLNWSIRLLLSRPAKLAEAVNRGSEISAGSRVERLDMPASASFDGSSSLKRRYRPLLPKTRDRWRFYGQVATVLAAIGLCAWMARGNEVVFMGRRQWDIITSGKKMAAIAAKNPESWFDRLNMRSVDYEAFQLLQNRITDPNKRVLLKLAPDQRLRKNYKEIWDTKMVLLINASAITGAGLVGVAAEYNSSRTSGAYYPYDYRASLFWHSPTADLLGQLSPDWILFDPALLPTPVFDRLMALPGIILDRRLEDNAGQVRILLHYTHQNYTRQSAEASRLLRLAIDSIKVETVPLDLVELPVTIETDEGVGSSADIKIAMLVADEDGRTANTMDMPIVGITPLGGDRYKLGFSMIQPGQWNVYFFDPTNESRLNRVPLKVEVKCRASGC